MIWNISEHKVGTEELAHVEIVSAMIAQLMKGATVEQIKCAGAEGYFTMHTTGVYPSSPTGEPHTAAYLQSKGDVFADIHEDLAADGAIMYRQHLMPPRCLGRHFD